MTALKCLRCDALVPVVGTSAHDGSSVDLEDVELDTESVSAMLTAVCPDCLGNDAALFLANGRARAARYLTNAEEALAGMKWVADGPLKDHPEVQRDIQVMEAHVAAMRAGFD